MGCLTEEHRDLLLSFEGYGPDRPSIVFMGQEERLGGIQSECDEIVERCELIRTRGCRGDKNTWGDGPWREPGNVNQWNYASSIVAAIAAKGCPSVPNLTSAPRFDEHWKEEYLRLGTHEGFTFLSERLPLPLPSGALASEKAFMKTYAGKLYSSRKDYFASVESDRLTMLNRIAGLKSVRWVFMYGAPYQEKWLRILGPTYGWRSIQVGNGEARAARSQGRIVVLAPFFGGRYATFSQSDIPELIDGIVEVLGLPDEPYYWK